MASPARKRRLRAQGSVVTEKNDVRIVRKLRSAETWQFTFFIDHLKEQIAALEARVAFLESKQKKTR